MPSIVSFHRNVGHAVILIILFSFFYLATPVCRFIHLLSETTHIVIFLPYLNKHAHAFTEILDALYISK